MLEVGKTYRITMSHMEVGEGLVQATYPNRTTVEIEWPVVRFQDLLGDSMVVNLSSPHFVMAEPQE